MRLSFVHNENPLIAGVVRERRPRECAAEIKNCEYHGANVIDLHLSCLDDEFKTVEGIKKVVEHSNLPILALNYNNNFEYGNFSTTEEERVGLLLKALEAGVAAIDMQGYTFDLESKHGFRKEFSNLDYSFIKPEPKEVVVDPKIIDKQCELIERVHAAGAEVLLSTHTGKFMTTEQLVDLAHFLEKRNPDILKIVTPCSTEEELAEAFKSIITLKKEVKTPVHFHCSGRLGKMTRIMNPMLGGGIIFSINRFTASSNYEQLDLETTARVVRDLKKLMK